MSVPLFVLDPMEFFKRKCIDAPKTETTTQSITDPQTDPMTESTTTQNPDSTTSSKLPSWIDTEECPVYNEQACTHQERLIVISFDGFRSSYMDDWKSVTPNLQKLRNCGIDSGYMIPSFPTSTFPNHYTIATGLYPESHGIVDNVFNDFTMNTTFSLGDAEQKFNPDYYGGEPIWQTVSKQGKTSAVLFWPGSDVPDYPDYWTLYDDSVPLEKRLGTVINWVDGNDENGVEMPKHADLMMTYWEDPDAIGHGYGPDAPEVGEVMKFIDGELGKFFDELYSRDALNCINLIIMTDHGMAGVKGEEAETLDTFLPNIDLDNEVFTRSGVPASIGKSLSQPDAWEHLKPEIIEALDCKMGFDNSSLRPSRILEKTDDLPVRLHWFNNDRINNVVLLMEDQKVEKTQADINPPTGVVGKHGFDNNMPEMRSTFLAMGPAFKDLYENRDHHFQNIEVYNIFSKILGVIPAANNGTVGALNYLMNEDSKETIETPIHTPIFVKDEAINKESTCSCDLWKTFGQDVENLNERLYLPHEIEEVKSLEKHLPFGISSENVEVFVQEDFVLFKNPQMASFTYNNHRFIDSAQEVEHCIRPDPRTELDNCFESESHMFLFPPSLSANPISLTDALTNLNIISNIDDPLKNLWKAIQRKYLLKWVNQDAGLVPNIQIGPVFRDGDSRPSHVFIIIQEINEKTNMPPEGYGTYHDLDSNINFVLPNWKTEPCDFDLASDFVVQRIMSLHFASIHDIELLLGNVKFMPKLYNLENKDNFEGYTGNEEILKKKLKISDHFWPGINYDSQTDYNTWRIPYQSVNETKYSVGLEVDLKQTSMGTREWDYFNGTSSASFNIQASELKQASNSARLVIHMNNIVLLENPVMKVENKTGFMEVTNWFYVKEYQFIVMYLPEEIANEKGNIRISVGFSKYRGGLDGLSGLYRSAYQDESGINHNLITTQCQTIDGRRIFAMFDEPGYKGEISAQVCADTDDINSYNSISNMPNAGVQDKCTIFQPTPAMSGYLFALTVTDFKSKNGTTLDGVSTGIYARASSVDSGLVDHALEITPKILDGYTGLFDVAYPLPKSDQFAMPDFDAGAMENWGIVIYREVYIQWNATTDAELGRKGVTMVVAHELAHQWFGNLVTVSWWNETFLNEGFATFVEYPGATFTDTGYDMETMYQYEPLQGAFQVDAVLDSRPIVDPNVNTPAEIGGTFDTISYDKGSAFLRMINGVLGDNLFYKGITNYLNENKYGSGSYIDLLENWDRVVNENPENITTPLPAGSDMLDTFDGWLTQNGYPLVTVATCESDENKWCVSQNRFLYLPEEVTNVYNVNLSPKIMSCNAENSCDYIEVDRNFYSILWLPETKEQVVLCNKVFEGKDIYPILNTNQKGFFKVLYPELIDIR